MTAEAHPCRCGARILPQQVAQRSCVAVRGIRRFVHMQYYCDACGQTGEKLLAYEEPGEGETEAPPDLYGPIGAEEVAHFAHAVGRIGAVGWARLRRSLAAER